MLPDMSIINISRLTGFPRLFGIFVIINWLFLVSYPFRMFLLMKLCLSVRDVLILPLLSLITVEKSLLKNCLNNLRIIEALFGVFAIFSSIFSRSFGSNSLSGSVAIPGCIIPSGSPSIASASV